MVDPFTLALLLIFGSSSFGKKALAPAGRAPARPTPRGGRDIPLSKGVVIPKSLTDISFPGARWEKFSPVPKDVAAKAVGMIPKLWDGGEGTGTVVKVGNRLVGFLAVTKPGGDRGVSVWKLKKGTIVPRAPKKRKPTRKPARVRRKKAPPARPSAPEPEPEPAPEPVPTPRVRKKKRKKAPAVTKVLPKALPSARPRRDDKPVLMQGASGSDVEELQRALGIGGTLGFYGKMTKEKVEDYQAANGLKVDGIAGGETWGALLA